MEKEIEKNAKSKTVIPVAFAVFTLFAAIIGAAVAAYTWTYTGDSNNIGTGTISLTMLESNDVINMTNFLPMSDTDGKALNSAGSKFDFAVTSVTSGAPGAMNYSLTVQKVTVASGYNDLGNANVKLYLSKFTGTTETQVTAPTLASTIMGASGTSGTLASGLKHDHSKAGTVKTNYRLRMWVNFDTDASSWTSSSKLQYKVKLGVTGNIA